MESLGFTSFWGFSPAIDFFKGSEHLINQIDYPMNILISECSDLRHILKSISDLLPLDQPR